MVESIFGGKSVYFFSGNERNILYLWLVDRWFLVLMIYLKIIFEIGDENMFLFVFFVSVEEEDIVIDDGLICYCWFRIMLLFVIYWDGLYLRIRCFLNILSFSKCRYLELGVIIM